jgi:rhodanese-related sulfurtransferase
MELPPSDAVGSADRAEISRDEIRRRLHDPTLHVVDVLASEAYQAGHIPGAVNLPLADLPERAADVLPDRAAEIAVYCAGPT